MDTLPYSFTFRHGEEPPERMGCRRKIRRDEDIEVGVEEGEGKRMGGERVSVA